MSCVNSLKVSRKQKDIILRTSVAAVIYITLGLSQSAYSTGGGLVTDDSSSLSGAARTRALFPLCAAQFP